MLYKTCIDVLMGRYCDTPARRFERDCARAVMVMIREQENKRDSRAKQSDAEGTGTSPEHPNKKAMREGGKAAKKQKKAKEDDAVVNSDEVEENQDDEGKDEE